MDHNRNNPFDEDDEEKQKMEDVSKMKEWVSLKLKELEDQNYHLKEENRKFNEELARLKEFYVKKSFTPEVRRKFNKRDICLERPRTGQKKNAPCLENVDSSSSDEEFFVTKSKYTRNLKPVSNSRHKSSKINQPRIDGANITLLSGNSRPIYASRAGSLDRKLTRMRRLNFTELKKQKQNQKEFHNELTQRQSGMIDLETDATNSKPPTPPLHRCPSWESRIYEIANNGIKSAISTPVQQVKKFEPFVATTYSGGGDSSNDPFVRDGTLPIFKNVNGRLAKIRMTNSFDESMSSDFESFTFLKSTSTTSSGNESDFTNELKMYIAENNNNNDSDSDQDYALPPDAIGTLTIADSPSTAKVPSTPMRNLPSSALHPSESKLEKSGYLLKLSGRFKAWKRRWFVVKDGSLWYYKNQEDFAKNKPKAQIFLDQTCKLIRMKECTFHLSYKDGKKDMHLSADCPESHNDWVRVITHTLTYNNIFKLQSNQVAVLESYLVKVRFGHSLKCWAALYGQYLVYFNNLNEKVPLGYTQLKNSKVQQIDSLDHIDDTVFVQEDSKRSAFHSPASISIHANDNSEPVYLLFFSKPDYDQWVYHITLAASEEHTGKSAFENYIGLLSSLESGMSVEEFYDHHAWNNQIILFTSENLTEPLTSLPTDALKTEALKLFKSIQLFISVPVDFAAIDYHVSLVQNSLKVCFSHPALQSELFLQLIKQSTPEEKCKEFLRSNTIHLFLCSPHSIFTSCNEPSSEKSSPSSSDVSQSESSAKKFSSIFLQCFQFLAVTISIFEPKNQVLWLLRHHLNRSKDEKTELGQYALYCERALQRVLANGPRKQIPSRMEVLSILQRNPYKHSMPHSIPVHFANSSYQVIGFDGSTTVTEFVQLINAESGIRDNLHSGFALYSDDPLDEGAQYLLNLNCKLADIISHWECNLRKFHLGKFESTKAIKLIYKHRLCLKKFYKNETDRERILWVYEINEEILNDRFPITFDLAVELMTLLMQIECGDYGSSLNVDSIYERAVQHFLPGKFRKVNNLKELILKRWSELNGRSALDCVRIYLNCTRKWNLCGGRIFQVKVSNAFKYDDLTSLQLCKFFSQFPYVWLAVAEDTIELLEIDSLRSIMRIPHKSVVNFGGHKSHFMLMVNGNMLEKFATDSELSIPFTEVKSLHGQRLLFAMAKRSIVEVTMLLADYINLTVYDTLPANH